MTANLQCIVVDDEPLAAKLIAGYVERTDFLSLAGCCHSAEEAVDIIGRTHVDLAFMDIHMPRLSGMQLARLVPENVKVIFTTAYSDYAVEGFKVDAVDYLLKPVSYDDFLAAANKALKRIAPADTQPEPQYLAVKSEYRIVRIPLADILYIEGLKDYVKIYLDGVRDPVLSLMSMKSLDDTLPSAHFMRVHRSFIVNLDKVRLVERNTILMSGKAVPVSDSYRRRFFDILGTIQP